MDWWFASEKNSNENNHDYAKPSTLKSFEGEQNKPSFKSTWTSNGTSAISELPRLILGESRYSEKFEISIQSQKHWWDF